MSSPQASTSKDYDDPMISSPSSSEESQHTVAIKKRKKNTIYTQKYNGQWEEVPEFKGWLESSKKGITFAHCKACNKDFVCGKSEIVKHSKGKQHLKLCKTVSKQTTLTDMTYLKEKKSLETKIKSAEIRFAAFAAEHNIAFNTFDHLSQVIRESFTDSEIAKNFSANRTKTTAIIKNVLGAYSFEKTVKLLQLNHFSLIVDESTDRGTIKSLAMVARVFDKNGVNDIFLGLLSVPDGTAEGLYNSIKHFFATFSIEYKKNMIGFASDGASTMMGIHNSLSTKLKADIPDLFLMKCVCHTFSLCANYACSKILDAVEQLCRELHTYLQYSFKRQTEFCEFQEFVKVKPHKILQLSQTRWLSLLSVVKRIIEQYDALKLYFTQEALAQKIVSAQNILNKLHDPSVKLYLYFLEFVLPFFVDLNVEMQSETVKIHKLYKKVETVLRSLLDCYLKKDYLDKTEIEKIEYRNPRFFLEIENIYLGAHVTSAVANNTHGLNTEELVQFRKCCLEFLIEGCSQIVKRFDNKNKATEILKQLSIISADEVMSKKCSSIAPLASNFSFGRSHLNQIDQEWRLLRNFDFDKFSDTEPIQEFWLKISKLKLGNDNPFCPNLCSFIFSILSLPHSSATVERIFSEINLNKTKIRNRLSPDTLCGILHTKSLLATSNCFNLTINPEMFQKFKSENLYGKKENQ